MLLKEALPELLEEHRSHISHMSRKYSIRICRHIYNDTYPHLSSSTAVTTSTLASLSILPLPLGKAHRCPMVMVMQGSSLPHGYGYARLIAAPNTN